MHDTSFRKLRVLHWPTDVGGHPSGLSRAERTIGLDSQVAVIQRSSFGYEVDHDLNLGSVSKWHRLAGRTRMLMDAVQHFDIIHLNFAQAFWPTLGATGLDLPLLKQAGKRIVVTLQGCDARLPERCPVCCTGRGPCALRESRRRQNAVAYATEHASVVYCLNPDLLATVPDAVFMPYASVDPSHISPPARRSREGRLRVVHAPSCRVTKGTEAIIDACTELGDLIELQLVENMTRSQALRIYAKADLIIDQIRLGWYGGLSTESMALAKPVVCHIDDNLLRRTPKAFQSELPIIPATEQSLVETLHELSQRPEGYLHAIGQAGRHFIERWHDPVALARWMYEHYLTGVCRQSFEPGTVSHHS